MATSRPVNPAEPARSVSCPRCRRQALYAPANPWRPFCSERCRQLDLGAWANEEFRVPLAAEPDDDGDGQAPPPGQRH